MSATPVSTAPDEPLRPEERFALRLTLAGFGLMFAAGALMWLRYGPGIFVDSLNTVLGCF
jgi:hypothetical protein